MNELSSYSTASDWLLSSQDYLDTLFTSGLFITEESCSYLLWSMTSIKSILSVATDLIELRFSKVFLRELVIFETLCSSVSSLSKMTSKHEQLELHSSKNFCLRRQYLLLLLYSNVVVVTRACYSRFRLLTSEGGGESGLTIESDPY